MATELALGMRATHVDLTGEKPAACAGEPHDVGFGTFCSVNAGAQTVAFFKKSMSCTPPED